MTGPGGSRGVLLASALLCWACAGTPPPERTPPPEGTAPEAAAPEGTAPEAGAERPITETITSEPTVRVGIEIGVASAVIMSTAGLRVLDGESGEVLEASGKEILRFEASEGAFLVESGGLIGDGRPRLLIEPLDPAIPIVLAGKPYHGAAELLVDPVRGLVVINRIGLEEYLLGVVPAEIGRRRPEEFDAVKAQAVAARTYAISSLGSRDSLGFDVFATVEDQAYGGVDLERAEIDRAVRETEGEILTYDGAVVLALYHSTCGGRTATRYEVWAEPDLPYLRSVRDRGSGGEDFCAISPRYTWRESWTPDEMNGLVRAELAGRLGVPPTSIGRILEIRVLSRTEEDRVDELEIAATGGRYVIRKNDIRFVLRPSEGRILGSTDFRVLHGRVDGDGVLVEGRGYGHGIGMCQWGAIGRARAGQDYRQILAAYYTSVRLEKLY